MTQNFLQTITKLTLCLTTSCIFILIALYPHQSHQQNTISQSSTIQVTCSYNYSTNNVYTCSLHISVAVKSLDVLEIKGNHLENHTDADVLAVVQSIDVYGHFGGEVLRKFENLQSICLIGSGLREVKADAFDACPKLEKLSITNGELSTLPAGMLKNCENLKNFEVMGQQLQTLPEDLFGNFSDLQEFWVPINQLTSLPEKLLQNMPNLRSLRIGFNNLTNLSPHILINAPNLEEVAAYFNHFHYQSDIAFAFNGKINLKHLWLNSNNFTNFDFRFFAQFQKLETLSIGTKQGPKLIQINWQSLPASMTNLTVYGICEEVPENAFKRVINLTSLTLHGHDVTSFQKGTFKALINLEYLFIYDTNLKSLHPELFSSQINLINLAISDSQIEELPAGIFTKLVNLGSKDSNNGLQITSSHIRRLNADSFGQHKNLKNIDFSFNDINEVQQGIFSKFNPNMYFAGFYFNECVSKNLGGEDLDNNEDMERCYRNWEEIDPNNTTSAPPTTTLNGSERNFKNFEVILIIFAGIFKFFT